MARLSATPVLALALAATLLGGCDTARMAYDDVAETAGTLWDKTFGRIDAPFNEGNPHLRFRDLNERQDDLEHWERIRDSEDPRVFQDFIARYPDSALVHLARRRLAYLQPTDGGSTTATASAGAPPPPEVRSPIAGQAPTAPLQPGDFPAPWILGRWAIDCSQSSENGGGVTYIQVDNRRVRVVRDDGSAAVYDIRVDNGILELDGNGVVYRDKVVSDSELRSYAVKYKGQWNKVDLTYRKCG